MIPRAEDYKAWWEDAVADRERLEAEVERMREERDEWPSGKDEHIHDLEVEVERLQRIKEAARAVADNIEGDLYLHATDSITTLKFFESMLTEKDRLRDVLAVGCVPGGPEEPKEKV